MVSDFFRKTAVIRYSLSSLEGAQKFVGFSGGRRLVFLTDWKIECVLILLFGFWEVGVG